jgi:hypothetical protein
LLYTERQGTTHGGEGVGDTSKKNEENLEAIEHLLGKEEPLLNEWEVEFLQSIRDGIEEDGEVPLSKKQQEKLDDIWADVVIFRWRD